MPRVVPSQVVAVMRQLFPSAVTGDDFMLSGADIAAVMGLVELIGQISQELMPTTPEHYSLLTLGVNALRHASALLSTHRYVDLRVRGYEQNTIRLLYDILIQCPDAAPSPATTALRFIPDAALREGLRLDLSTAYQALANGEWKPATVLAGSVVEALLLWAVQQHPEADWRRALVSKGMKRPLKESLEHWGLQEYIAIAEELSLITPRTVIQSRQAQDFRNLIHPGRAQRLAQVCDRGTALAALAAVEMVVSCLE